MYTNISVQIYVETGQPKLEERINIYVGSKLNQVGIYEF